MILLNIGEGSIFEAMDLSFGTYYEVVLCSPSNHEYNKSMLLHLSDFVHQFLWSHICYRGYAVT